MDMKRDKYLKATQIWNDSLKDFNIIQKHFDISDKQQIEFNDVLWMLIFIKLHNDNISKYNFDKLKFKIVIKENCLNYLAR